MGCQGSKNDTGWPKSRSTKSSKKSADKIKAYAESLQPKFEEALKEKASEEVLVKFRELGMYLEGPWEEYTDLGFDELSQTVNNNWWVGQKQGDDVQGYGLWINKDGLTIYQGFMQKEKPHGKGRLINLDIYYCEGDWVNGKLNGFGKLINF